MQLRSAPDGSVLKVDAEADSWRQPTTQGAQVSNNAGTPVVKRPYSPMPIEQKTLDAFVSGSPQAIRLIFAEYNKQVFTVTMSMLGNRALAEEALQQTFLNAWRRCSSFDASRSIAPWLYAIARRASIDLHRREKRHDHLQAEEEIAQDSESALEGTWEAWQLREAIDQLRVEDRDTLRAVYFEDLSHEDAATKLGIAVGTVKSRVNRAQKRLSEILAYMNREEVE